MSYLSSQHMSCVSTRQMSWLSTRHMSCVSTLSFAQCSQLTQTRRPKAASTKGMGRPSADPKPVVVFFVMSVNTGHILMLRRKTCALVRAQTSALLRRKTCAVLRARTYSTFRATTKESKIARFPDSKILTFRSGIR